VIPDMGWSFGPWNARFGFVVGSKLLVGAEYSRWERTFDSPAPYDIAGSLTLSSVSITGTYFPFDCGALLRGGGGMERASYDAGAYSGFDTGFMVLGAVGYEAQLTDNAALGLEFSAAHNTGVYAGFGTRNGSNTYRATLQLTAYW
ncbi:MAG TPA: hypothetical protein VFX92_06895, partial [Candidatus Krumholzibacteria bacterium]|nr:hypothetical protein [Candidatus Krumholzibacteria bacterium]